MRKTTEPKISTEAKGEDFTKITFYPDLAKYTMKKLDADTVALLSRKAHDAAGYARGINAADRFPAKLSDYASHQL
ncbi:DNA topoisomerase 2-like [Dermacentor albipictus]|uniref:DNA topoisomerase 2-like n=1 Tax=Dermacentor albipictus TaxID=60249 RepID=UPI0038FC4CBB